MPNPQTPRTGLRRTPMRNPSVARQRRAAVVTLVKNPVLSSDVRPGHRAGLIAQKTPFDFQAIRRAYNIDGYIRQAVDKHAEAVLKEGFWFKGDDAPVKYLERRFEMMSLATGEPWQLVIDLLVRDYCSFGNSFLVIAPSPTAQPFDGMSLKGLAGQVPIGGYFNLPVDQVQPEYDDSGKLARWVQRTTTQKREFDAAKVLHFTYCRAAGEVWGTPPILAAIEDIRAYRQMEENIQRLVDKHLNPLIHQEVPDITGDGQGRQEDVDDAVRIHQAMAPDGYLITPPGHKISILGVESKALRADAYATMLKLRVYSDLDMTEELMGEKSGMGATSDEIIAPMIPRVKFYQKLLGIYFTYFILNELLLEGGFDPYGYPEDRVEWCWHEIDIDRRIKEETHALNQFTMNVATLEEIRAKSGYDPITKAQEQRLYLNLVQIPQLVATHTIERINLGMAPAHPNDPTKSANDDGTDSGDGAGGGDDGDDGTGGGSGGSGGGVDPPKALPTSTRNRGGTAAITKVGGQGVNAIKPANQHGVKFSPNAPRAHKMHQLRYEAVLWADRFYQGESQLRDLHVIAARYGMDANFVETIFQDVCTHRSTAGVLAVQNRLLRLQA